MGTGKRISSIRVGDAYIGLTSTSDLPYFCLYSEDSLYLGLLVGDFDEKKNIKYWRLRLAVPWLAELSGTDLAPEAALLLDRVALTEELENYGFGREEIRPRRQEFLVLLEKAKALGLL